VAFLRLCLPLYTKIVVDNYINFMILYFWLYLFKFLFNLNEIDMQLYRTLPDEETVEAPTSPAPAPKDPPIEKPDIKP
jgi:hypothetical protein